MCSFSTCIAYSDIEAKIRISDDVVFLTLQDKKHNSVSLTFNSIQLLTLNKYLFAAIDSITLADVYKSNLFGNLTVEVENENIDADNFKIPIGCSDNELIYDYAETA